MMERQRQLISKTFTIEWENGADFAPEFLYEYGESKKKSKMTQQLHRQYYI